MLNKIRSGAIIVMIVSIAVAVMAWKSELDGLSYIAAIIAVMSGLILIRILII